MLRWLSRLFRQRDEADAAAATAAPLQTPPLTVAEPAVSQALMVTETVEAPAVVPFPEAMADAEGKETCPTCGRTSVFAGPPGQRFCTYCALRDELFERSAAATE
ncbi:MAG: hypothetical protein E6H93_12050 [Chloroflexi bacterium]|nr:MAG: hypothetical protein E6H93_12050 [Chloroflexota bacterium]